MEKKVRRGVDFTLVREEYVKSKEKQEWLVLKIEGENEVKVVESNELPGPDDAVIFIDDSKNNPHLYCMPLKEDHKIPMVPLAELMRNLEKVPELNNAASLIMVPFDKSLKSAFLILPS